MEAIGVNWGLLFIQVLIFGAIPALSLIALFALRQTHITGITQALWVLLIVAIPILGALAFFIVKPVENTKS